MRYNEDDIAALEEIAAQEREDRELERIRKRTRAKMRAAMRYGYKSDLDAERKTGLTLDDHIDDGDEDSIVEDLCDLIASRTR